MVATLVPLQPWTLGGKRLGFSVLWREQGIEVPLTMENHCCLPFPSNEMKNLMMDLIHGSDNGKTDLTPAISGTVQKQVYCICCSQEQGLKSVKLPFTEASHWSILCTIMMAAALLRFRWEPFPVQSGEAGL